MKISLTKKWFRPPYDLKIFALESQLPAFLYSELWLSCFFRKANRNKLAESVLKYHQSMDSKGILNQLPSMNELPKARLICPVYRFVQQYVSHLLPALKRLEAEPAGQSDKIRENVIRFEVGMALALSARDSAWSHALKCKLLERNTDLSVQHTTQLLSKRGRVSKQGKDKSKRWTPKNFGRSYVGKILHKQKLARKIEEKRALNSRMKILRKLTPGGNKMETNVLFEQLGNYIACLKTQVHILHYLAENSGIIIPTCSRVS